MTGIRTWHLRPGTAETDLTRPMSGDARVAAPDFVSTLAIEIDARPEDVWPWLMQMGYRRGGLYSYDWLDRLFGYLDRPSANRILPEFQTLEVGDIIPVGRGQGFPVAAIEPPRSLVLGGGEKGFEWTWEFGLYRLEGHRTRLVSRNRARTPTTAGWKLFLLVLKPAAFLMTRRMLLGIKQRVEAMPKAAILAD